MKPPVAIKKTLAILLTMAVVFTVTVRDVHYLFAHHSHEHCENHLHSQEHQHHCSVCKFDASLFTDVLVSPQYSAANFTLENSVSTVQYFNLQAAYFHLPKRGPPAIG